MQRFAANLTIRIMAVLTLSVSLAMAHGTRHAGNHEGDAKCVKPIQEKGAMGVGYWENNCRYGVQVKWAVESEEGAGCRPRSDVFLPCSTYVKAQSKVTAHTSDNSGRGQVLWIACKAESSASDPFPVLHKVRADKTVEYGCYHLGYGPGRTADKITPVDRIMRAAKRSNLRSGPGTDHEKVGLLEVGEQVRVTGEIGDWLRIKAPRSGTAFVYASLLARASPAVQNTVVQKPAQRRLLKRIIYPNGDRYEGQIRDDKRTGQGTYIWPDGRRYEGEWRNGNLHGHGTYTWANGDRYDGQWRDDKRTGQGTYIWPDGTRYEGDFVDGKQTGHGIKTWPDGRRYEGEWRDDKRTGRGTFTWPSGDRYEGDFVDDKRHGRGTYYLPSGARYDGEWRNGDRTGWGTYVSANGKVEEGEWKNNKLVRLSKRLEEQRRLERERREAEWEEWEREQAEQERQLAEQRRRQNARVINDSLNMLNDTIMQYRQMKELKNRRNTQQPSRTTLGGGKCTARWKPLGRSAVNVPGYIDENGICRPYDTAEP